MSKSMKKLVALMLAFVMVFSVACGQQGADKEDTSNDTEVTEDNDATDNEENEVGETKDETSAVLVTDQGGVNDKSFNQSAHEGMTEAEDEGWLKYTYLESHNETDYAPNLENALDSDPDIIWSIGYALYDATADACKANPDQKFAIIDNANLDDLDNLIGVTFADHQNSFLVGYIAGMTTESNNVGFVGGQKSDVIDRFEFGFRAGVMEAAREKGEDIEVQIQYADSYSDAAKGKTIANQMYEKGADVVFHAAGGTGDGVISSAKENNKWVIGVDRDQSDEAPDHMLASTVKGVNVAVKEITRELLEGKFDGGTTKEFTLEGDGVAVAYGPNDLVEDTVKDKVEELKESILSGDLNVPQNEEEFNEMGYDQR